MKNVVKPWLDGLQLELVRALKLTYWSVCEIYEFNGKRKSHAIIPIRQKQLKLEDNYDVKESFRSIMKRSTPLLGKNDLQLLSTSLANSQRKKKS